MLLYKTKYSLIKCIVFILCWCTMWIIIIFQKFFWWSFTGYWTVSAPKSARPEGHVCHVRHSAAKDSQERSSDVGPNTRMPAKHSIASVKLGYRTSYFSILLFIIVHYFAIVHVNHITRQRYYIPQLSPHCVACVYLLVLLGTLPLLLAIDNTYSLLIIKQ